MQKDPTIPFGQHLLHLAQARNVEDSPALQTDELSQQTLEAPFRRTSGREYFWEGASLIFTIENVTPPLVLKPASTVILGRTGYPKYDKNVIDLTPYGAAAKGVSRVHAMLHKNLGWLEIEDMGSSNGTYLNGRRLTRREVHILHDGDELRLGALIIRISYQ